MTRRASHALPAVLVGLVLLCAPRALPAGEARRGVDVNQTPPLNLAWPFFDWEGTAEEFTLLNHWRSYYYEHEFHFWLRRDGGERVKMVSRESTSFTDDWRLGPTYLPVEVDWAQNPRVRVVGVKLIDRDKRNFHDMALPDDTCTPLLLYVRKDDRWVEWMVNNWFHDWHKYINPDTQEEHPGLDNVELAQYYIGKRAPYDVCGHMNAISPDLYDEAVRKIQAGEHKGHIYHGFLVSDAAAPKGYRIELAHMWLAWSAGLNELPGFGEPGTLKPHFVLPQLREWNFSGAPWPLTLALDTPRGRKDFAQGDVITLVATLWNHSQGDVKVALPNGDPWHAFELRSGRRNVSTRPPVSVRPQAEVRTLRPGEAVTVELPWDPLQYGYADLKGNDVPLALYYGAGFFCDAAALDAFPEEVFSTRIHLKIQEARKE